MKRLIILFTAICFFGIISIFAQEEKATESKNYEVVLQIIAANNSSEKQEIPQNLSNVVKKLRSNYNFTNYRLAMTFLERATNLSKIENRSIFSESKKNPTFFDWRLNVISNQKSFLIENFMVGFRVPVELSSTISYEQLSLSLGKFNLNENSPTLIGSLLTPKVENSTDEMLFVVLTLKPEN